MNTFDTIVIGGGIIGMSIARSLAKRGQRVAVFDRSAVGLEASKAAAGMLMPQLRTDGPLARPFFSLCVDSLRRYKQFVAGIAEESGTSIGMATQGTLLVTFDKSASTEMQKWRKSFPLESKWKTPAELLRLEPALAPDVLGGAEVKQFWAVHSQDMVALLGMELSTSSSKISLYEYAHVRKVEHALHSVTVVTDAGSYNAGHVVIAAGSWSSQIEGIAKLLPPVKPIRGQIIKVLATSRTLLKHVIYANKFYLVPRGREILIGSTLEDVGFEKRVTVGASADLLAKAARVLPAIAQCGVLDSWAGLRPMVADGYPVIGRISDGIIAATGHYRDGILLAPATAAFVTELICEGKTNSLIRPFGVERFLKRVKPAASGVRVKRK